MIASYKMLIITGISNEKTNLTINGILCQNVTIFSSHVKILYLYVVFFSEHDILHF